MVHSSVPRIFCLCSRMHLAEYFAHPQYAATRATSDRCVWRKGWLSRHMLYYAILLASSCLCLICPDHPTTLLTLPNHVRFLHTDRDKSGKLDKDRRCLSFRIMWCTAKADAEARYFVCVGARRSPKATGTVLSRHTLFFPGLGRLLTRHFQRAAASVSVLLEPVNGPS